MVGNIVSRFDVSLGRVLGAALALTTCLAAQPATSASSTEGESPGRSADVQNPRGPAGFAVPRPQGGPSRLDENGNGLSDGLEARLATLGPSELVAVIVTFDGPGDAAAAQRAVGTFAVSREYDLISGFAATMSATQAEALANVPGVFRVQLDGTVYGLMETARRDFGVDLPTGAPAVSETGADVVICVADTGIWAWHEQFADSTNGTTKVEKFRDFIGEGASQETLPGDLAHDEQYHGTMVAAIAAGDGTPEPAEKGGDSIIAGPLRGVAPGAVLWGAQVLEPTADGSASGEDSGVIAAIEWCVSEWQAERQAGSDRNLVINLSLGSPGGCDGDALALAVDAAFDAGATVIAAAGNSGDAPGSVVIPACAAGAFPVAAAADNSIPLTSALSGIESNGRYVAPFSSRGDPLVAGVAGPGVSVATAFNTDQALFALLGCNMIAPDGGPSRGCYAAASGTSFAAPFVSGVAALMLEANPSLAPADVYRILGDTAQPWGPGGTPNIVAGNGMVDGQAAVKAARGGLACMDYGPNPTPAYTSEVGSVPRNGTVQIPVWIEDPGQPLAITMTIDGRASGGLWSPDLDMFLLDANGEPYLVDNPLYPWLSSEPFVPAPGTSSTCPAGEDCGLVGAQETIHLAVPPVAGDPVPDPDSINPNYFLEIRPWEGFPNRGKGGSFTVEFSNAHSDVSAAPPDPCVLAADAGPNQEITDEDGDGFELVTLDGSGSTGGIASYLWTSNGTGLGTGVTLTVSLGVGEHSVMLTVSDVNEVSATDSVVVTVKAPKKGGGGNGNCKNPNKAC